jgi:hypothetical protein
MENTAENFKPILEGLNKLQSEELKRQGYTNECFFNPNGSLTKEQEYTLKEKAKYFYLDCGGSGVFMIAKEDIKTKEGLIFPIGSIFNIKGYGTPNFKKMIGNIQDIDINKLFSLRWNYKR